MSRFLFCHNCYSFQFLTRNDLLECNNCLSDFVEETNNVNFSINRRSLPCNSYSENTLHQMLIGLLTTEAEINNVENHILDTIFRHFVEYSDEEHKFPPLTKEKFQKIKKIKLTNKQLNENLECPICLQTLLLKDNITVLDCHHTYHYDCIVKWLKLHNVCPICRTSL